MTSPRSRPDLPFPDGKNFAFTIMDDTDVATVENVRPVYELLHELGFRTTKTAWPLPCEKWDSDFIESQTLANEEHLAFVRWLAAEGFEIAYHGATMESSDREQSLRGLKRFRDLIGQRPRVHANHAYNRENLYWGVDRVDDRIIKWIYRAAGERPAGFYQGHVPGSPWWWADRASEFSYVRNLSFREINTLRCNPSMPYHDPCRPEIRRWFSGYDADGAEEFNELIAPAAQDRLEREGGVCIIATHLGKGFASDGAVNPATRRLLERLVQKAGWFVPVSELLDWLAVQRGPESGLPSAEWRAMQWRWAWDLLVRNVRRHAPRMHRRGNPPRGRTA